MTKEEAKLLLIRPTVSSNVISETKAREIEAYNMAIEALSERTGEWIDVNGDGSLWRCDQCKDTACCKGNFCPNCGTRMTPYKGGDSE